MMQTACMRCGHLTTTRRYGSGLLALCDACPLAPVVCPEYQHECRGSRTPGTWVCLTCGQTKTSQAISTAVVRADAPTPYDVYC